MCPGLGTDMKAKEGVVGGGTLYIWWTVCSAAGYLTHRVPSAQGEEVETGPGQEVCAQGSRQREQPGST